MFTSRADSSTHGRKSYSECKFSSLFSFDEIFLSQFAKKQIGKPFFCFFAILFMLFVDILSGNNSLLSASMAFFDTLR